MKKHSLQFLPVLLLLVCWSTLSLGQFRPQAAQFGFSKWIDDDHYAERRITDSDTLLLKVNAKSGKYEKFTDTDYRSELTNMLPEGFNFGFRDPATADFKEVILTKDNNLFHFSRLTGKLRQITANMAEEKNPTFSPDGKKIAFTREMNLFVLDLESGLEKKLTEDGGENIYNGYASWVYYEEILGRGSRYRAFWWSPDSKKIAFLHFDDSPVPIFPIFRSSGVHGELEKMRYPKPGDPNPKVKLGITSLEPGQLTWVDTNHDVDQYIAWPFWATDSKQLLFQQLNRDQNHIELFLANPESGVKKLVYEEKRTTWIDFFKDIYMFKNGNGFILRSHKSDWLNLYHYDFSGKLVSAITNVPWRVNGISEVFEDQKMLYFTGTGPVNTDSHLFSVKLDGSGLKQLTAGSGRHRADVSPAGDYFVDNYSNVQQAPVSVLYNRNGKEIRSIRKEATPKFDPVVHHKVELFTIPSNDGKFDLPAVWTLPADFDENKKYPIIFSIYGGPNAGSVSDSWRGLNGNQLTRAGIIVITVDHRASGKFGKKGLDYMHRNLGRWEIEDYSAAVNWLREQPFIDEDKIGITGGSYGGYTTALALTLGAEYFTHGIANLSVMDWKLYDNVYTERYMDKPEDNPEGYEYGSVLTHIDKYKGKLLLTHGLMDDNVHMQNSVQFIDKMQDAGKDFEMMFYPNERHGWGGPKAAHVNKLRMNFWNKHFFEGSNLDTKIETRR